MRVLVCGGRNYTDKSYLFAILNNIHRIHEIDCIIEGNQKGADRLASLWAKENDVSNLKFDADWTQYGNAAGPIRNRQMIKEGKPDIVIAFPGGKGTADMIKQAKEALLKVYEV